MDFSCVYFTISAERKNKRETLAIRGLFCYNKIVSSRLTGPQTPGRPQAAFPGRKGRQMQDLI